MAKPLDKAKQLRRVPSDTSEEEEEKPARPARRRGSDSEDLESGDSLDSAGAPVAPGARAEKSEESGDELFHHQDLQTAEVGSKKSAARVEVPRIEARTSGNFGSASQRSSQRSNHSSDMSNGSEADQDSPTWGTDLGAYAETAASGRGPGLTGHMSPSLVPWGGFQRLRDSVAPGPGWDHRLCEPARPSWHWNSWRQQICSKASASPAASSRCQSGARRRVARSCQLESNPLEHSPRASRAPATGMNSATSPEPSGSIHLYPPHGPAAPAAPVAKVAKVAKAEKMCSVEGSNPPVGTVRVDDFKRPR